MATVGGIASICKGVANYDLSSITEGFSSVSGVLAFYTRQRGQFDMIEQMATLSTTDFAEFKATFFDNTLEKNKDHIKFQKQECFTYFLLSTLDKAVRNRTLNFKDRMEAISLFKYAIMNVNYNNKQPLEYYITENERLIVR